MREQISGHKQNSLIPPLIGIAGGIGSGKSVVSRLLRLKGLPVYDCDLEAASIMSQPEVVKAVINEFGPEVALGPNKLDRKRLANIIFADSAGRGRLEAIVHPAVARHLRAWIRKQHSDYVFVESAILAGSGLAKMCSAVWLVSASEDRRISRVQQRSNLSVAEIHRRIQAQQPEMALLKSLSIPLFEIDNSGSTPLLPRITSLLQQI